MSSPLGRVVELDIFQGASRVVTIGPLSHPTVEVTLFGPKVSDGLSSLSEEPAVVKMKCFFRVFVLELAHTSAGRVARTNFFHVRIVSGEILSS